MVRRLQPKFDATEIVNHLQPKFDTSEVFAQWSAIDVNPLLQQRRSFDTDAVFKQWVSFDTNALLKQRRSFDTDKVFKQWVSFDTSALLKQWRSFDTDAVFKQWVSFDTNALLKQWRRIDVNALVAQAWSQVEGLDAETREAVLREFREEAAPDDESESSGAAAPGLILLVALMIVAITPTDESAIAGARDRVMEISRLVSFLIDLLHALITSKPGAVALAFATVMQIAPRKSGRSRNTNSDVENDPPRRS